MPKRRPNSRSSGKPRGGFTRKLDLDWNTIESFYIQGEILTDGRGGNGLECRKPSYADCARRFGCSKGLVYYYAKQRNWQNKRDLWERRARQLVAEEVAKARALSFGEASGILDAWLLQFQDQLQNKRVRTDSLSDFATALKLKAFIAERGTDKQPTTAGITLQQLQAIHKEVRQAQEQTTDALAGVIDPGPEGRAT